MKIGIPKALLYHWYGPFWESYLGQSGFEVLTSPDTDRNIMKKGAEAGIDELCLPVKIFLGHLLYLADKVDRILIPHLIKVEPGAYLCPKFMGLPDIVANAIPAIKAKMATLRVGPKDTDMVKCLHQFVLELGGRPPRKFSDWSNSQITQTIQQYLPSLEGTDPHKLKIGLLGHPYCLYDSCFNLNLLESLRRNEVNIFTPEMIPPAFQGVGSGKLRKTLFWTIGKMQFDALEWMLCKEEPVDGFIMVTSFACGPEAMVGDLLERRIKAAGKPVLKLNYEEHSGEAGMITRVEAFLDLIKYHKAAS